MNPERKTKTTLPKVSSEQNSHAEQGREALSTTQQRAVHSQILAGLHVCYVIWDLKKVVVTLV